MGWDGARLRGQVVGPVKATRANYSGAGSPTEQGYRDFGRCLVLG